MANEIHTDEIDAIKKLMLALAIKIGSVKEMTVTLEIDSFTLSYTTIGRGRRVGSTTETILTHKDYDRPYQKV